MKNDADLKMWNIETMALEPVYDETRIAQGYAKPHDYWKRNGRHDPKRIAKYTGLKLGGARK